MRREGGKEKEEEIASHTYLYRYRQSQVHPYHMHAYTYVVWLEALAHHHHHHHLSSLFLSALCYVYLGRLLHLAIRDINKNWMKQSLPWMVFLHLIGAILFATTVLFWNLYMTDETCILFPIFGHVGFSLLSGLLCFKSIFFYLGTCGYTTTGCSSSVSDQHQHPTSPSVRGQRRRKAPRLGQNGNSAIAVAVVGSLLMVDTILLSTWLGAYTPRSLTADDMREFRDTCHTEPQARSLAAALVAVKGAVLIATAVLLWLSKADGYRKSELQRIRSSVHNILTAGVIALIMELAFTDDSNLNFIVRSLAILGSSCGGTTWLFYTYRESKLLDRIGERQKSISEISEESDMLSSSTAAAPNNIRLMGNNKIKNRQAMNSAKVFERLFDSEIIRGYMLYQCAETYDTESVQFCSDVYAFKEEPTLAYATELFETYIEDDSEKCINISSTVRENIKKAYERAVAACGNGDRLSGIKEYQRRRDGELWNNIDANPTTQQGASVVTTTTTTTTTSSALTTFKKIEREKEGRHRRNGRRNGGIMKGIPQTSSSSSSSKLATMFDTAFKEVRRLVYLNNWRPFRDSDYALAAGSWLRWLEYMEDFPAEVSDQTLAIRVVLSVLLVAQPFRAYYLVSRFPPPLLLFLRLLLLLFLFLHLMLFSKIKAESCRPEIHSL